MSTRPEERIWERAQAGKHTAVIGIHPDSPTPPMNAIHVACDVPQSTLGPIAEAKRKLDIVLGKDSDFMDQARDLFVTGLRRRFLGDVPERGPSTAALVDACHRMAATGRQYTLIFDAVDAADEPALEMLQRIVRRQGGLGLPMILAFRDDNPPAAAEALLHTVRQTCGDDAVIVARTERAAEVHAPAATEFDVRALPADVRQVLRAGAVIGSGFEADLLAALLERSRFDILDCLQRAADAGVPIDDRGEERFFLPEAVVNALLASTLPSMQAAWHRQLGWLLTEDAPLLPRTVDEDREVEERKSGALDELGLGAMVSSQLSSGQIYLPLPGQIAVSKSAPVERGAGSSQATVVMPEQESDSNDERTVAVPVALTSAHADAAGIDLMKTDEDLAPVVPPVVSPVVQVNQEPELTEPTVKLGGKLGGGSVSVATVSVAQPASVPTGETGAGEADEVASAAAEAPGPSEGDASAHPDPDLFAAVFANSPGRTDAVPVFMATGAERHARLASMGTPDNATGATTAEPVGTRIRHPTRREIPVVARPAGKIVTPPDDLLRNLDDSQTIMLPADFDAEAAVVAAELARQDTGRTRRDSARAASHLSASGQIEAAAQKYASAAGEASAIGAYEQAMAHGRKALRTIESLPTSPERRRFRAQLLVSLARLQWQAAGLLDGHPDPAFTLDSALETADVALASIEDDDPDELVAEAREVAAGICYDMGSKDALERALDELTRSARLFLAGGKTVQAARLLNDQAAVYVRLGDPVRATHLLGESQKIFEHRAADDPLAIRELAETHHLLARLPLHAAIRPGREADAYAMALHHAGEAENRYRNLGAIREIARVWEVMGRLELASGDVERATERIEAALQVQSQTGDLTGLARSTGALSDVLAASGRLTDALAVLGDSITLNTEKGSPIGLAFNRRALTQLIARVAERDEPDPAFGHMATNVRQQLEIAENQLGRVALPPEPGQ